MTHYFHHEKQAKLNDHFRVYLYVKPYIYLMLLFDACILRLFCSMCQVVGLVTAQAGSTGYAANPSRDLGPRIAHFVLPIPNKVRGQN